MVGSATLTMLKSNWRTNCAAHINPSELIAGGRAMAWESVFIVSLLFLTPGPTRSSLPVSSDPQDDLSAHVSMFHLLQGLDGLLEWIDMVDDHLELSGIDQARNAPQQLSARLPGEEGCVDTLLGQPGRLGSHGGREEPATGPQDLADVREARRISGCNIQHRIDSSWIERGDGAGQVPQGIVERLCRAQA